MGHVGKEERVRKTRRATIDVAVRQEGTSLGRKAGRNVKRTARTKERKG